MLGDIEVENLTTVVTDHEEAVEQAEPEGWNSEEVHRRDSFPVIPQKCEPTFDSLEISWRSFHPAGDRSLGNIKTKHHELAVDARRSPRRILRDQSKDQISRFL